MTILVDEAQGCDPFEVDVADEVRVRAHVGGGECLSPIVEQVDALYAVCR